MSGKMHNLRGVLYIKEKNILLCLDQFGNEIALAKEGEPAFADWDVYNYVDYKNGVEATTPLCMCWEIKELPNGYEGDLFIGKSRY